jgi:NAD(P)-dependent dehydrogenase (short-subunit alcohol dehydrogenase family)
VGVLTPLPLSVGGWCGRWPEPDLAKLNGRLTVVSADDSTQRAEELLAQHPVPRKGTFLTSKAVLPHLVAQGRGSVVNMSSIAGRDGYPLWAHYTASKHAIIGLTRALARELGPMGVRVNAVCPGAIATQMWGAEAQQTDDPEAALATMAASMPLRRPQTAADVAAAVAFLLSDDAASITGQSLGVDGGLVM